MDIFWTIDGEYITIRAQARTSGPTWIGIAWGATDGKMTGADMVCATVVQNSWVVQDYYSTGYTIPGLDGEQDLQNTEAGYDSDDGISFMVFTRKLDTGDSQDHPFVAGSMDLGYAVGFSGILAKHKDAEHDVVTFF